LSDEVKGDHLALLRQQTILAKFGELALKSDDLDEILTEACRLVGEALGTDLAKVVELQADGHTLLVRAGVGWKPGVVGKVTIQADDDTSEGMALKTGEPMISPDIGKETRFRYPPFLTENGVRAVANVIIIGGKDRQPFGILQVDSREPRPFTDEDTIFLRSYANLVAAAVDRMRTTGDVREGEERLRRSHEALEQRVVERTRDLVEANDKLRTEAAERERIEDALRQSHKMEAVGQLTGGLAHDFNNLLAGISGSLELIRMRVAQGRPAEIGRYVEAALSSVSRAAALTHRLLAFSRRQTLDPKPIGVDRLVASMADLFRRTVGPSIQIETRLAGGLWPTLCDPNQLENALLNLVINARDAMPDGGHLMIEAANVVLDDERAAAGAVPLRNVPSGEYVVLAVTDSGTGMSPTTMTRAFDPFFTTKPLGQGTGLGLSMIYGFVQQSGGYIHLRSGVGQGTTITIYLPRHFGTVDSEAEVHATAGLLPKRSAVVLVVEDELPIRMVIADVLSDLGYTVLEAGDGSSGLKILEAGTLIDLLITDVGLPGDLNGRQLADAARQRRPDLNVLFITGYAENAAVGNGLVAQGMQVMTKPFALDALAARIQGIIGR
jgi:signal transduction histidine kinase/CheY-like chemotaxis protein